MRRASLVLRPTAIAHNYRPQLSFKTLTQVSPSPFDVSKKWPIWVLFFTADHFFEKWLSAFLQENQAKKGSFLLPWLLPLVLQLRAYHFSALLDVFFLS